MSVGGKYNISLKTPFGVLNALLELLENGTNLSGKIVSGERETAFDGGKIDGNNFSFSSTIQTPMGKISSHVTGSVVGDKLEGAASIPFGSVKIDGERAV